VQTGDHPALAGYQEAELPFTLGYVMTEAKPTAQLLLAVETGDPLMAIGRYGLGTGLAYTSDLTEKWGGEWLAWEGCGKFWAQMIRGVLRKNDNAGMEIVERHDGDQWRVAIRRTDAAGDPLNDVEWDAAIVRASDAGEEVEIREVGLGRYEAVAPHGQHERLALRLRDADHDKMKVLHWHRPYPNEYRLAQQMPAEVAALRAPAAGGAMELATVERQRSVSHFAYFGALACLLGSVLLRRV
jgi:hypothetical protein